MKSAIILLFVPIILGMIIPVCVVNVASEIGAPFNQYTYDECGDDYYKGFIEGCTSVQGNTKELCESATDA